MFGLDNIWQAVVVVFFIVIAVLTLFMPIFVMQIRDSAKQIRGSAKRIELHLAEIAKQLSPDRVPAQDVRGDGRQAANPITLADYERHVAEFVGKNE